MGRLGKIVNALDVVALGLVFAWLFGWVPPAWPIDALVVLSVLQTEQLRRQAWKNYEAWVRHKVELDDFEARHVALRQQYEELRDRWEAYMRRHGG